MLQKNQDVQVLQFAEVGGDAQIRPFLVQFGCHLEVCTQLRKLLKTLRKKHFDMLIADFHQQHNFSMQGSNLDALFSQLSSMKNPPDLTLLTLSEDLPHLESILKARLERLSPLVLTVPLTHADMRRLEERLARCKN